MEYLIMAYGRDFEPMAEIFCDSYMILEFHAMSTKWPNVERISRKLPTSGIVKALRKRFEENDALKECVMTILLLLPSFVRVVKSIQTNFLIYQKFSI